MVLQNEIFRVLGAEVLAVTAATMTSLGCLVPSGNLGLTFCEELGVVAGNSPVSSNEIPIV